MISWIIEKQVFRDEDTRLCEAAVAAGHGVIVWDDDWLANSAFPIPKFEHVLFHGSLGNAAQIRTLTNWDPGAFCDTDKFNCSSWYPQASKWLLQKSHVFTNVRALVENPGSACPGLDLGESAFVRPDSPLKPFSGRIVRLDDLSLRALDHGFYYEDEELPIVVCAPTPVGREWRFVIADSVVIAGSEYVPEDRSEGHCVTCGEAWDFAQEVASELAMPERVCVLDVCESNSTLRLLELNPFSGADLYACDRAAIVTAVEEVIQRLADD